MAFRKKRPSPGYGRREYRDSCLFVIHHPRELLGDAAYADSVLSSQFGFDFLDSMQGGIVAAGDPLKQTHRQFWDGLHQMKVITCSTAPDACVTRRLRPASTEGMIRDLHHAQENGASFEALNYVNKVPAHKHDHFLIPAGTIHCSGANSMVLEISATHTFLPQVMGLGSPD